MSVQIITGDCREVLRSLPSESVHCVVTSPPYWGLRNYNVAATIWGGAPACPHEWTDASWRPDRWGQHDDETPGDKQRTNGGSLGHRGSVKEQSICARCNAWRGTFGLEPTYQLYVEHAVEVFREVRRVLRKDGTLWLNLGDSYAAQGGRANAQQMDGMNDTHREQIGPRTPPAGLKLKDLVGVPWRVAFALQADGWWLRQDIIWSKPNPMPESVIDRCTKAHEYIFLLSKSERYYYDAEAIKESAAVEFRERTKKDGETFVVAKTRGFDNQCGSDGSRNKRSVWEIATSPFPEAHFATFPPSLIDPCILAGCPEKCCAKCGAPWVRQVERSSMVIDRSERTHARGRTRASGTMLESPKSITLGWSPSCSCNAGVVGGTVLDPFGGAGTTGLVADRLKRNAILIELNPEYAAMAELRIRNDAGLFAQVRIETEKGGPDGQESQRQSSR